MAVLRLALLSGVLGATASCLAKFALAAESPVVLWTKSMCVHHFPQNVQVCRFASFLPRGLCLLLMVSINILVVGTFVEGMDESGSVAGTALASAANFAMSAMFGIVLWNETINRMWLFGFCLVIFGAGMLSTVTLDETSVDDGCDSSQKKNE